MDWNRKRFSAAGSFALAICITTVATQLSANTEPDPPLHPEGTLKLASRVLVAGTEIELEGKEFQDGAALKIFLVGLAGRIELTAVTADSVGEFTTTLSIPDDLEAGGYRLVAVADDGDEVATLNVEIRPAESTMTASNDDVEDDDLGNEEHSEGTEPSARHMELDRAQSPLVRGGAIVGIILALAAGGMLLRTARV